MNLRGRSIGIILLSIYLIIIGLEALVSSLALGIPLLTGLLALAAGIALLLGR
ncbi:MAG TPA: hypothetical protein VHB47_26285 [Thermoanaerobaculia bacterium]|jgi:hypothetical protein|nr:hypothetical protein [Thermoanaerobaculia bacterium]HXO26145.1 hypothetical protein [Thermoanaerobaculia bacterium]